METTGQWAGDANNKGLPIGLQKFDTVGKAAPIITGVADTAATVGQMYLDATAKKIYFCTSVGPVVWSFAALT
jgi:hypothetical protein